MAEPSDAELRAHLAAHSERYRREPRLLFEQRFVARDKHGTKLAARAGALLAKLQRAIPSSSKRASSDSCPVAPPHAPSTPAQIARRHPWVVAAAFGLLHGLGFAGALSEIGLPAGAIPLALLSFNVGVELGQLAFVAVVLVAAYLLHRPPLVRLLVCVHAQRALVYALGALAGLWLVQRTVATLVVTP